MIGFAGIVGAAAAAVFEVLDLPCITGSGLKLKILMPQLSGGVTGVYTMAGLCKLLVTKKLLTFLWSVKCSCSLAGCFFCFGMVS